MNDDLVLVAAFDAAHAREDLHRLLGGKGAGLASMTAAGLPVPPGFTLTTDAFSVFRNEGWTARLDEAIEAGMKGLESSAQRSLGGDPPLLVSVRSGAPTSMPGMLDTVLNVGMNDAAEAALATFTGDATFAADTHTRALLNFADVVLHASDELRGRVLSAGAPAAIRTALAASGLVVPDDPREQIGLAVRAVFESWDLPRAQHYREVEGIDHAIGTAATVQMMVFGNLGTDSGTGVAFTRDPATGAPGLMGDFLAGAQGEDVVAGGHVTRSLSDMAGVWPAQWKELDRIASALEREYADMVDIEFTVERGRLWMLQARRAKRSPIATFRSAIDMANDPDFPVDRAEAVRRCAELLKDPPTVVADDAEELPVVASGIAAAPGRSTGVLCVEPEEAVRLEAEGVDVVLARRETSPSDVHGIAASRALFTTLGGMVSHAAVVARSWGLPAVVGASEASVDTDGVRGPTLSVRVGEVVTVDGDGGRLLVGGSGAAGAVAPEVQVIRRWAGQLSFSDDPAIRTHGRVGGRRDPFELLHALRIKGMATADVVASMLGRDGSAVLADLDALAASGTAQLFEARGLWRLTPEGREEHAVALHREVADIDLDRLPYAAFLELNLSFKEVCTDWQLRDGEANDHSDDSYDRSVLDRLEALDRDARSLLVEIGVALPWTARYADRLAVARDAVLDGDPKRFTGVMCDSYHDIWMELHEDLIVTQGIDRAAEGTT